MLALVCAVRFTMCTVCKSSRKCSPPHLCACEGFVTLRCLQYCVVRNVARAALAFFMRASDRPRLTLCVAGAGASLAQGGDPCSALLLAETGRRVTAFLRFPLLARALSRRRAYSSRGTMSVMLRRTMLPEGPASSTSGTIRFAAAAGGR